jgi:hypothetical protein
VICCRSRYLYERVFVPKSLQFYIKLAKMQRGSTAGRKSIVWAYVCWLFGGIFGLHLFYLERDAHAFLTWSTLGGYGLGWLADITKIPRYVKDCNDDPKFLEELGERMRRNKKVNNPRLPKTRH